MSTKLGVNVSERFDVDVFKWFCFWLLVVLTLGCNFYFAEQSWVMRLVLTGLSVATMLLVSLNTEKGQRGLRFCLDARSEFKKVVWPSKEETRQATLVVALMVLLMSLVLWGLDAILLHLMSWITGQGI